MNTIISNISIISNNAKLTEQVVSHFRRGNQYLPIFDVLYGTVPDIDTIANGEFINECIRINNCIKFLKSSIVLLIDCQKGVNNLFNDYFSPLEVIEISKYDIKQLSTISGFKEKPFDLRLYNSRRNGKNIIIVENNENDISKVIAQNLAIYTNAILIKISKVTRDTVDKIKDMFYEWMNSTKSEVGQKLKEDILNFITNKIDINQLQKKERITFITRGIPYGFYPFDCPTTHIWIHRSVGLQIIRGIIRNTNKNFQSVIAYICDPSNQENTESNELGKLFSDNCYNVKMSIKKGATVRNVNLSTTYLPLDFIYYSTHCGNVGGKRILDKFKTLDGKTHSICYDEVLSLSAEPNTDMFHIVQYMKFVSIDDVNWSDNEGKEKINVRQLVNRYSKCEHDSKKEIDKIERKEICDIDIVKGSSVLKMHDSNYLIAFHQVGGHRLPIVFNNACSTWHELAVRFAIGGSSAYIGTSIDINNLLAIDIVLKFTKHILSGMSLGKSLYESQKDYIKDFGYTPYLMHGFIDLHVNQYKPFNNISERFHTILKYELESFESYAESIEGDELRDNAEPIIKFLREELHKFRRSSLKK